mmetsp:Transcript_7105/g.20039  ORF Transcript_7105/g.20039 Transcript_7105/m.20039 type:complete len:231 (-) Transcript_7105:910-1602(-)
MQGGKSCSSTARNRGSIRDCWERVACDSGAGKDGCRVLAAQAAAKRRRRRVSRGTLRQHDKCLVPGVEPSPGLFAHPPRRGKGQDDETVAGRCRTQKGIWPGSGQVLAGGRLFGESAPDRCGGASQPNRVEVADAGGSDQRSGLRRDCLHVGRGSRVYGARPRLAAAAAATHTQWPRAQVRRPRRSGPARNVSSQTAGMRAMTLSKFEDRSEGRLASPERNKSSSTEGVT